MTKTFEESLFDRAKNLWGVNSQICLLAEESSELSVSCLHLLRKIKNKELARNNFVEELADVQIVIEELLYYMPELKPLIAKVRQKKINRFEDLILKAESYK